MKITPKRSLKIILPAAFLIIAAIGGFAVYHYRIKPPVHNKQPAFAADRTSVHSLDGGGAQLAAQQSLQVATSGSQPTSPTTPNIQPQTTAQPTPQANLPAGTEKDATGSPLNVLGVLQGITQQLQNTVEPILGL